MAWAEVKNRGSRDKLRFVEPGQPLYCTSAGSNKVYFRINMKRLFAISRLLFMGKTKRDGASFKCDRDDSLKHLSLFSSLDGILWSPYGIYNQIHGDKIRQVIHSYLKGHYHYG